MPENSNLSSIDQPACYEIIVKGRLDSSWTDWLEGLKLSITKDETGNTLTVLAGPVPDQAALHGLLRRLGDLGLTLLEVHRLHTKGKES